MELFFGAVLVVTALVVSFFLYAAVKMAGIEDAWMEQHRPF
jgi:hypothetical protein